MPVSITSALLAHAVLLSSVPQTAAATPVSETHAWIHFIAVTGAVVAMLGGLWLFFARTRESRSPFGDHQLKALGLILFLPTLLIVSVVHEDFGGAPLAALLGTVAGYVLSQRSHSPKDE